MADAALIIALIVILVIGGFFVFEFLSSNGGNIIGDATNAALKNIETAAQQTASKAVNTPVVKGGETLKQSAPVALVTVGSQQLIQKGFFDDAITAVNNFFAKAPALEALRSGSLSPLEQALSGEGEPITQGVG